jgi:hypothetical protein
LTTGLLTSRESLKREVRQPREKIRNSGVYINNSKTA